MLLQLKGCFPAENAINAVCSDVIKQKIILTERIFIFMETEAQKVLKGNIFIPLCIRLFEFRSKCLLKLRTATVKFIFSQTLAHNYANHILIFIFAENKNLFSPIYFQTGNTANVRERPQPRKRLKKTPKCSQQSC